MPTACAVYSVRPGNTLSGIARAHGVTLAEIVDANPGINPDRIAVGQQLNIPGPAADVSVETLRVVTRDEWGAKPYRGRISPLGRVQWITVHHTATPVLPATTEVGKAEARRVQAIHHGQGWADTGYHALLDQAGTWYVGRQPIGGQPFAEGSRLALGSHVARQNTGNVGLSVLGWFHEPHDHQMTPAAVAALRKALRLLLDRHGLDAGRIRGHREWPTARTVCPGDRLMPIVAQLRAEL